MRRIVALSAVLLAACAYRTTSVSEGRLETNSASAALARQQTQFATAAIPNMALATAAQQLESHGVLVGARQGDWMITSVARPVPPGAEAIAKKPLRSWVTRVDALRDTTGRVTDLRVVGWLIPMDSTAAAIQITKDYGALYTEVQQTAQWIQLSVPAGKRRSAGHSQFSTY